MAKKLKLIKGLSDSPLKKLNEGQVLKNPDKYVFEGVFTQCSTKDHKIVNRNGRIYMETAVLQHLGYLRDMIKENNGRILGELDHPEGRFEVSMKEASHMITDLWYDQNTHCVMGRLEVLDTPNGKTLKSLIEAGYPLYVSSRAAGDVDPKTKEVEIAQIFTYDVVCTPGFKEARLERVNESLLTDGALKYINESAGDNNKEIKNDEVEVPMEAINENVSKFNNTKITDVVKPLNEDDEASDSVDENNLNDDVKKFLPVMNMGTQPAPSNSTEKKEELKEEGGEDKASEEDKDKENLENPDENSDDNNDENSEEEVGDDEKEEKKELTDEEKEANREKIVSVKGMDADGNILGDEAESDEDGKSDDIENIEAETEDSNEENKDGESDKEKEPEEKEEANEDAESESAKAEEKTSELKKKTDEDVAELESILASVKKKEEVKESIIQRYPFAAALTESNFAKFAALRPKQKKRVLDFINEHEIYDIQAINELWKTPLTEEKQIQQNWLKLASQSDIDLYVAAPMEVQNAIEEQAKYFPMETEADVDAFWNMTGLRQQAMRKAMNEQMVNDYNSFIANVDESVEANLGYDPYLIRQTELWLQNDEF